MVWYEEDVKRVEKERDNCPYKPQTLFYGSSTFTLWSSLYQEFEYYKPLNLGFGGSTLAACVWFFDRIVAPVAKPKQLLIYAGDNDLGDGRHPEEVYIFFQQLVIKIKQHFKKLPTYFISIKPSISRTPILQKIKHTNSLIEAATQQTDGFHFINVYDNMVGKRGKPLKEYFAPDGLHLSAKGYNLWKEILLASGPFK